MMKYNHFLPMHTNTHHRSVFLTVVAFFLMQASLFAFTHIQTGQITDGTTRQKTDAGSSSVSLLQGPVRLQGNKVLAHMKLPLLPALAGNHDMIKISYNLHGLCILGSAQAVIDFIQNDRTVRQIPLTAGGKNCHQGIQSIDIPLEFLHAQLRDDSVSHLQISVWYPTNFSVEIDDVIAYNKGSAVLGISVPEVAVPVQKTFDHITPIRSEPYAKESMPQ